jgi:proline iminopeptidase
MKKAIAILTLALTGCLDPGDSGNLVPKTVDEDPALPRIEVAHALLHAEAFGDPKAPLVIALHGGPGEDYRSMLPLRALADDGYRVVFWDQRGAGLSQRHDAAAYSFDQYLEDLRLVVEHFTQRPDQPLVFIGHSWGAMYASWFINEYGDYGGRVQGAILSEPGAFTKQQLDAFLKRLQRSFDFFGERLDDALWAGQFMSSRDHARADYMAELLAFGGAPSEMNAGPAPIWRYGAVVAAKLLSLADDQGFDWTTHLDEFEHKVLFLRGDLNTATTLEHQKELAASYADAEIVTIAGVGHEMIWERPKEYLEHTRTYFKEIGFGGLAK